MSLLTNSPPCWMTNASNVFSTGSGTVISLGVFNSTASNPRTARVPGTGENTQIASRKRRPPGDRYSRRGVREYLTRVFCQDKKMLADVRIDPSGPTPKRCCFLDGGVHAQRWS